MPFFSILKQFGALKKTRAISIENKKHDKNLACNIIDR